MFCSEIPPSFMSVLMSDPEGPKLLLVPPNTPIEGVVTRGEVPFNVVLPVVGVVVVDGVVTTGEPPFGVAVPEGVVPRGEPLFGVGVLEGVAVVGATDGIATGVLVVELNKLTRGSIQQNDGQKIQSYLGVALLKH